jgi:gliding motility-associated-like protein
MKERILKENIFNHKECKVGTKSRLLSGAKLNSSDKVLCVLSAFPLPPLRLILFILFLFWSYSSFSQTCTTPLPPVLTLVTVDPESGKTDLNWTLSSSTGVAAYIIYTYENGDATPIDTLWNPSITSYTYLSTAYKYFSKSFVVAAYRLPGTPGVSRRFGCPSELSNVLNTIFINSSIDTCSKKITLSWNSYNPIPKKINSYSLLSSVNGASFTEVATVSSDKIIFVLTDFTNNSDYCFSVRANLEGGTFSTAYKSCLSTRMQIAPRWINTDQVSVNQENKIFISYTIDPQSEITHFRLERRNGISGSFKEIAQPVSSEGKITYIDGLANIDTIYYYRLSAVNNCNIPLTVSDMGSNIVLKLEKSGEDLKLLWNSFKKTAGNPLSNKLFINTGNGFEQKSGIQAGDTTYILAYKELMYQITTGKVCFYISASETSNPYGIASESLSSRVCTSPAEIITTPNVFTPNSGTENAYFKPVLSFVPKEYYLVVTSRQGSILFETKDYMASWDGTQNGNVQSQDVYLWFLKVITPSGKTITKTGTVTVIKR